MTSHLSKPYRRELTRSHLFRALRTNVRRSGLLIAATCASAIPCSVAHAQANEPIYWPRNEFVIPFQVDSNGQAPEEVILEVSEDGGQSWSQTSRGNSRTRNFQFRAGRDGEYIFRLKTVDSTGRRSNNPGDPLRIIVDTTKPTANLTVHITERGEMVAQFLMSDNAIDSSAVTLEYQTDVDSNWKPIQFQLSNSTTPGEIAGNGTWNLPHNANQLVVRLVVRDRAGNVTETTRLPQLPKTAALGSGMHFASQPTSVPPYNPAFGGNQNQFSNANQAATQGNFGGQFQETNRITAPNAQSVPNSNNAITLGPADPQRTPGLPVRELTDAEVESFRNRDGFQLTGVRNMPLNAGDQLLHDAPSLNFQPPTGQPNQPSLNGNPTQPIGLPQLPRLGAPKTTDAHKTGIEPLHSNTRAFSLDYRIENDPGAPITEVELWGTVDQGRTWEAWGLDPDRTSPFDIEVESDGLFGFRMVIVGANGLASNRPRSGDDADAWIQVDTTKPLARISSALYGKGQDAGSLIIEYTVNDDFLPERPISLFYSETPNGPWESISRGIRNQGRYIWPSNPNLPPKIYLRIEAIDLAGNVTSSVLDLPIDVEGIAPRGRIQGFRPLGQ